MKCNEKASPFLRCYAMHRSGRITMYYFNTSSVTNYFEVYWLSPISYRSYSSSFKHFLSSGCIFYLQIKRHVLQSQKQKISFVLPDPECLFILPGPEYMYFWLLNAIIWYSICNDFVFVTNVFYFFSSFSKVRYQTFSFSAFSNYDFLGVFSKTKMHMILDRNIQLCIVIYITLYYI
jgi:hypothetical protein